MKKLILLVLALSLLLCAAPAPAENASFALGQPFPDFTATDTDGSVFTLSEALKDHEAVLVNLWATWCIHCIREFPDMNQVYAEYKDRVAFIALSTEPGDTMEIIDAFRKENGLDFPMARDEGQVISSLLAQGGIPVTVIVDRFGNAAFLRTGRFNSADELRRTLDHFLSGSYTESAVLDDIPPDAATAAFPLSGKRSLTLESENAKLVTFKAGGVPLVSAYIVPDETARVRVLPAPGDNPVNLILYDAAAGAILSLPSLLDTGSQAYLYDLPVPVSGTDPGYTDLIFMDVSLGQDPDGLEVLVFPGEASVVSFAAELQSYGYADVTWEETAEDPAREEESALSAYVLRVVDQYGDPVPAGVCVNFCTDTTCTLAQSVDGGTVTFDGPAEKYHVQLLKVPDGYSFDPDFELYTAPAYSQYLLRIRKD